MVRYLLEDGSRVIQAPDNTTTNKGFLEWSNTNSLGNAVLTNPAVSPANHGRIFFDGTAFNISENAGGYKNFIFSDGSRNFTDGTVTGLIKPDAGNFDIGTSSNHPVRFFSNNVIRGFIDTTGRFLWGTSSGATNANLVTDGGDVFIELTDHATTDTKGFLTPPTMNGAPTGTVNSAGAMVWDHVNNKLWFSVSPGTWKSLTPA